MKYQIDRDDDGRWVIKEVWKRGSGVIADPLLNKGTAFTPKERELFELEGLIPNQVTEKDRQVARGWAHIVEKGDMPLEKYIAMVALMDRNETLFYQVLADNVSELIPIVYTPTVGDAAVKFSRVFRRGRGLWITPEHKGRIFEILGHARCDDAPTIRPCSMTSCMSAGGIRDCAVRSTTPSSRSSWKPSSVAGRTLCCNGRTSRRRTRSVYSIAIGIGFRRSTTTSRAPVPWSLPACWLRAGQPG
jgi:hypothetical protein